MIAIIIGITTKTDGMIAVSAMSIAADGMLEVSARSIAAD